MQEQDFFGSKLPNKCITHHTAAGGAAVDMGEREEITASFTRLKSSFLHKDTSFSPWSRVPVATAKNEASSSTRRVEQYLPQPEPRSYHNALRPPLLEFGRNLRPPSTIYMNLHYDKHIENFPQRPGKPECRYFLKTGLCKFNSTCRFHHPKDRIARLLPMCDLNDKGLPLRPYQHVCWHYISHGTCQYGAACIFHHPQLSLDFIDIP